MSKHFPDIKYYTGNMGYKLWIFPVCPFNDRHLYNSYVRLYSKGGGVIFRCLHDSCTNYGWNELVERIEKQTPNYIATKRSTTELIEVGDIFEHYEGDQYRIMTLAKKPDGNKDSYTPDYVVYYNLKDPDHIFVRTIEDFLSLVEIPRFRKVK